MRLVLDTNTLINAYEDDFSASAKLLDAIIKGELTGIISHRVQREYQQIMRRLINDPVHHQKVEEAISRMENVVPKPTSVIIDDPDDLKFIEAALGGQADAIVTNDHHLIDIGEVNNIVIITPTEAWTRFQEESGETNSEWNQWIQGLGL
jgi:uncharacterized protein